jgi:hypothetical protein
MKVWITLDYLDGSHSRVLNEPKHIDEIDLHGMLFKLNTKGVAGVTFTRADVLQRLIDLKKEQTDSDR